MAEAPADSPIGTANINPLLRQRMLNRAATFTEAAQRPEQSVPRRRSSVYSDTRHSFRSSTDSLLRPSGHNDMEKLTSSEESSFWHSAPLAFAVVPAFAGLLFQNGGSVVTDILLLGFGSMFLNWCLRAPWDWYNSAQQTHYIDFNDVEPDDTILEEDERSDGSRDEDAQPELPADATLPEQQNGTQKASNAPGANTQESARKELHTNELLALTACFMGPLVGAYFLHAIRSQLTRPAEGLVSNFNLTIFVMASELRPVSHIIRMKQARLLRLQRVVRSDPKDLLRSAGAQELSDRIADLETRVAEPLHHPDTETIKIGATVRQSIQPQLDALNRAVRRYEKRQAAQSMQVEARFHELDGRLRDALSLAAAAARSGQRPGIMSMALTWFANIITYTMQTSWTLVTSPFRTALSCISYTKGWYSNLDRQPQKRAKGHSNGTSSVPTSRVQSRSGR